MDSVNDTQVMHAMGLDDSYRVERVLARGADGETECVTFDGSGPFVRKKIALDHARRSVWASLADCDCARLPRVRATYETPDRLAVVYDFVPGDTLERYVAENGALPTAEAARLARELCEAAGALHKQGIIHRDISPSNAIVSGDGAHLIDLGIAQVIGAEAEKAEAPFGTWGFAAPEQYGFARTDARSDVYSIGRMLGFMLTGVRPDDDGYVSALQDEGRVSPRLRAVVERASAFEPSARYQSAEELSAAIAAAMSVDTTGRTSDTAASCIDQDAASKRIDAAAHAPAHANGLDDGGAKPRKRRGLRRWLYAVALLVVVVAAAGVAFYGMRAGWFGTRDYIRHSSVPSNGAIDSGADASTPDNSAASSTVGSAATGTTRDVLEIGESGWSVDSRGYVNYGVALINTSDQRIMLPSYTVVGRDESGAVLFSNDMVLTSLMPSATAYVAGMVGNGTAPTSVEFVPIPPRDSYLSPAAGTAPVYTVSNVMPVEAAGGAITFSGEVTLESDGEDSGNGLMELVLILRDEHGNIVYGASQGAYAPQDKGAVKTFTIWAFDAPEYTSAEVYANPV